MKKLGALSLVLLIVTGALAAQDETGTFSVTGWARANYGWDFEADQHLGKPDGDWDATGAGTTLSYQKGDWTTAGEASVTTEDFGATYGASGNIKTTWAQGDWTVYGKLSMNFGTAVAKLNFPDTRNQRTLEFSVENWKQDVNDWGIKALAQFKTPAGLGPNAASGSALLDNIALANSDDNKAALFINFWDKKILLETGFGDYADAVWTTPGPLEVQYESKEDEDSALRLQVKPLTGLNVGFAWLPAVLFGDETFKENNHVDPDNFYTLNPNFGPNAGLSAPIVKTWEPVYTLRAITYGAKYSDDSLTAALGFNFQEDNERGYLGGSYKLGDLTFKADTEIVFPEVARNWNLGEAVVYAASPWEIGLTLKENHLIRSDGATKDMELYVNPYVQYDLIEKIARGKLSFELTKGLGEDVKESIEWSLVPSFGWSLKETVALDPDDIGTGFVVKYKFGMKDDGITETTTNQLYFGFKTSF